MELLLVMFTDKGERRDFRLKTSRKSTIGRNTECSLQIPLGMVSRRHCEIRVKDGNVIVRDLGSSNGTYVNDKRIQEFKLHGGDTLKIGPVIFTVVIDGEPDEIKPIPTILEHHKKNKKEKREKPSHSGPRNPDDTGSIDLEDSAAPLDLVLDDREDDDEPVNPLAELEALSRQKKP
jgi:pSer/pThr/pTyr-binding forkhead associated (FHA) protein